MSNSSRPSTAIVVVAHGSRHPAAATAHAELCEKVAVRLDLPVVAAYLDHQEPALFDALVDALATHDRVTVVPHFIHPGGHTELDIPRAVHDACVAAGADPDRVTLVPPTGVADAMVGLVADLAVPHDGPPAGGGANHAPVARDAAS